MLKTLFRKIKGYERDSILAPLFVMLESIMELVIPLLMAVIIDSGISQSHLPTVYRFGLLMIVASFTSLLFGVLAGRYAARASTGFACNLRSSMFANIQQFSFSNIDTYSTAGLVTRLTTDVTNLQNAYQMILRIFVRAPVMLIFALIMTFSINQQISIIFVVAILFLAVCLGLIIKIVMKLFDQVFRRYDDLNASVQENVAAIRVVKSFVRETFETEKFQNAAQQLYKLFVKAESILSFNNPAMMISIYGCILALSWFGAKMVVGGSLTTGQLTSLFSYVMSILISLMMLSMVFVIITMSLASMRRIAQVLNETPDIQDPASPRFTVTDGSIDFKNVSFSYGTGTGEPVLQGIDLHIASGETIGIIGGTGSAKSSLVNLLSRLYDVTEGEVRVGGKNVQEYGLEALRNQVAVVLQKNVLFSGTILENLRWGNPDATEAQCQEACRQAQADEFIQRLPDRYATYLEQDGSNVSGGQKQRLCIARALLKNPKILILDDSTSAVDTATDGKIRQAFRESLAGVTKIIIAQRVSSIEDADRIIVMDDGHISGLGTHQELLKNNQIYREVYEGQTQTGGDFDEKAGVLA